ncbi:hypothetical protein VTJ83DRAFT_720 [Remersonia thermophila]|uniref:Nephrocystin 3-like N-terminal domain-containing protein n=1 Tax=Remersonia thermophila TaxID=72144 RepID=A0ABR4DP85_9PEZI
MSAIVAWLQTHVASLQDARCCVAYFYFSDQDKKSSHDGFLRSLLEQLTAQDPTLSTELLEEFTAIDSSQLTTTKLESLAKTALLNYRTSYVLVDWAEECQDESAKSIEWLQKLTKFTAGDPSASLRVLVSGRRDGVLDVLLQSAPDISLDTTPQHADDIRGFCQKRARDLQAKLHLTDEFMDKIVSQVCSQADGMILYVKVMMSHLENMPTLRLLKRELEGDKFPRHVHKLYERVFSRILESEGAKRDIALNLLRRVICAKRTLYWREIQAMECIKPETSTVEDDDYLRLSCKQLCGSLLDVDHALGEATHPDNTIRLVHSTARRQNGNAELASLCLRHLTSSPFTVFDNEEGIVSNARKGFYAFHDYAVQCWYSHLMHWANSIDPPKSQTLAQLGGQFLQSYALASKLGYHFDNKMTPDDLITLLRELPKDDVERSSFFNIETRTVAIRRRIEWLRHRCVDTEAKRALEDFYGRRLTYKCPKPWCLFFVEGMETEELRHKHISRHDLPFRCHFEGCWAYRIGFDEPIKLKAHKERYHTTYEKAVSFPRLDPAEPMRLWEAAKNGDIKMVESLLDSGVDIKQPRPTSSPHTALAFAATNNHTDVCKLLISRGAACHRGDTFYIALTGAIVHENMEIIDMLLARPKPYRQFQINSGVLHAAIDVGFRPGVRALQQYGVQPRQDHLLLAIRRLRRNILQDLIAHEPHRKLIDEEVVKKAAATSLEMVELVLSTGQPHGKGPETIIKPLEALTLPSSPKDPNAAIALAIMRYPNTKLNISGVSSCNFALQRAGLHTIREFEMALNHLRDQANLAEEELIAYQRDLLRYYRASRQQQASKQLEASQRNA